MTTDFDLRELQRVAWIYAKLIRETSVRIRLETGTDEGLGDEHPNLGVWSCYVDYSGMSFCGTVVNCAAQIRERAAKILGPGYL